MSGRRGSRTLWWLSGAIVDANLLSCYLLVHQIMLWKARRGMTGRKAHLWTSICEKGEVCYIGSMGKKQQVTLLGSKKQGVCYGEWWHSQQTGLRGACGRLVHCPILNSCHITAHFIAFAGRDIFNSHFYSYRTVWLSSALNFIGGLLKNSHLQN